MKKTDRDLFLHQAALLLALRDEKGTIDASPMYEFSLGGALVAELLLAGRVVVDSEGKKDWLRVVDKRKVGEPLLDEALGSIVDAPRRKRVRDWVQKFARIKRIKHRVADGLVKAGILRVAEDKVLFVFNRTVYPEVDHGPEQALIDRIRNAVLSDDANLDPKLVILIALGRHTGLLRSALDRKELKARKKRLEQIEAGEVVGRAVKSAVEAMQAAIMVAVITPTICASAAH